MSTNIIAINHTSFIKCLNINSCINAYVQIVEEAMSTTDSIFADVSGTQITQESSGSLDPDDECKYLY